MLIEYAYLFVFEFPHCANWIAYFLFIFWPKPNVFQGCLVGGEMQNLSDIRWHAFMYMSLHLILMCKWINTKMLERQNVCVLLPRASILLQNKHWWKHSHECVCNIGLQRSGFQSHMGLKLHGGNYCFYNKINSKSIHLKWMVMFLRITQLH